MAEVLGSFADRDGDAEAAQRFYAQLEQVSVAEVRRVLEQLAARTPARVDIPPQVPARRT
jgi:predicted phosphoribosyltransferase